MPNKPTLKHITIAIVLFVLSIGLIRSSLDIFSGGKRLSELKNEVADLEKKRTDLQKSLEYKKTNEYVEERARNDLNLVKSGEKVYVVTNQGEISGSSNVLSVSSDRKNSISRNLNHKDSNIYRWFKLFF